MTHVMKDGRKTCEWKVEQHRLKLDTGSDVNLISDLEYRTITPNPRLEKSQTAMTSYSGGPIPSLGVCCMSVHTRNDTSILLYEPYANESSQICPFLAAGYIRIRILMNR